MTSADNRTFPRYYTVKAKNNLVIGDKNTGLPLAGKIVDVSRDGLGFLADASIVPGTIGVLQIGEKSLEFTVVYCTQDIINPNQYRVGLNRHLTAENLVTIFQLHELIEN